MFTFIVLEGEVWIYRQVFIKKEFKTWSIGKTIFIGGTDGMNNLQRKANTDSKFNLACSLDFNHSTPFSVVNTKGFLKDILHHPACVHIHLVKKYQ